jgi:putative NADH-flavin reductase
MPTKSNDTRQIMKVAIFGVGGRIGSRVAAEAITRGHKIVPIVRDASSLDNLFPSLEFVIGDVTSSRSVAAAVRGMDAIVSAVGPSADSGSANVTISAATALTEGAQEAGVRRLLVVGGAGSLEIAPGLQEVDAPDFPAHIKSRSLAQREALAIFRSRADTLDWTYISPPRTIVAGNRTGMYRVGFDQMIFDSNGLSTISIEDFAVALVDELEVATHVKKRITVAY